MSQLLYIHNILCVVFYSICFMSGGSNNKICSMFLHIGTVVWLGATPLHTHT